jgi:hypothetical protein
VFAGLLVIQMLLLCDMICDLRWKLHAFGMHEAMANGVYGLRSGPQTIALLLLVGLVASACAWVLCRFRARAGAAIAIAATIASVGLWCTEAVSLHGVDAIFYHSVGSVMFVSLLWVGLSLITCAGLWIDYRTNPAD